MGDPSNRGTHLLSPNHRRLPVPRSDPVRDYTIAPPISGRLIAGTVLTRVIELCVLMFRIHQLFQSCLVS